MRDLTLGMFLLIGALLVVFSCQKEVVEDVVVEEVEQGEGRAGFRERHVLYVAWTKFGRKKTYPDCTGFGLCDAVACAFCCVIDEVIIDCDDDPSASVSNSGEITVVGGDHVLTITLNPNTNTQQANAIQNQSILYVDEDILVDNYTIKQGDYVYTSSVGTHGGYLVDVEEN